MSVLQTVWLWLRNYNPTAIVWIAYGLALMVAVSVIAEIALDRLEMFLDKGAGDERNGVDRGSGRRAGARPGPRLVSRATAQEGGRGELELHREKANGDSARASVARWQQLSRH